MKKKMNFFFHSRVSIKPIQPLVRFDFRNIEINTLSMSNFNLDMVKTNLHASVICYRKN